MMNGENVDSKKIYNKNAQYAQIGTDLNEA